MLSWILLIAIVSPEAIEIIEKESLLQLLETARTPIRDLYCEFEGRSTRLQETGNEKFGPDGIFDEFSGALAMRRDGAYFVDIYHHYKYKESDPISRETVAILSGRCEIYQRSVDRPDGRGEIAQARFREVNREGSLGRIYCERLLLGYLRHPDWTMTSEKPEWIDGHECLVVTFHRTGPGETEPSYNERFWIDLARGGHPLKREVYFDGGRRSNTMEEIVLREFQDDQGTAIWLPISGVYKSYLQVDEHGERTYRRDPTNLETYSVLLDSIRLNQSIPDERFSIEYRNRTLISDQLRRAQYEFGQARLPETRPLTRAEVEAQLDEQLRIADAQGDELRAASWERGGRGWSAWLPTTLVGSSLVLLLVLLVRRYVL